MIGLFYILNASTTWPLLSPLPFALSFYHKKYKNSQIAKFLHQGNQS